MKHSLSVHFTCLYLTSLTYLSGAGAGVGLPQLGWRLVFLMSACLYIGNALKDLVCAPRPTGMGKGDVRPKLIASNAEAATYALVRHRPSLLYLLTSACLTSVSFLCC